MGGSAIVAINNMSQPNFNAGLFLVAIGVFLFMGLFAYALYRYLK